MRSIQDHIATRQAELARHPFLADFRVDSDRRRSLWFAPLTAFWAMGFQDVIQMNAERVQEPELRDIVYRHRAEDAHHDEWFVHDLRAIGHPDVGLTVLYSPEHRATREATYAIASEVFRASHDVLRLALVLSLEGAGHAFFGRVARALHAAGADADLLYFADSHLDVEKAHDLFERELQSRLDAMTLSRELRAQGIEIADRVFAAFRLLADGFMQARTKST